MAARRVQLAASGQTPVVESFSDVTTIEVADGVADAAATACACETDRFSPTSTNETSRLQVAMTIVQRRMKVGVDMFITRYSISFETKSGRQIRVTIRSADADLMDIGLLFVGTDGARGATRVAVQIGDNGWGCGENARYSGAQAIAKQRAACFYGCQHSGIPGRCRDI